MHDAVEFVGTRPHRRCFSNASLSVRLCFSIFLFLLQVYTPADLLLLSDLDLLGAQDVWDTEEPESPESGASRSHAFTPGGLPTDQFSTPPHWDRTFLSLSDSGNAFSCAVFFSRIIRGPPHA